MKNNTKERVSNLLLESRQTLKLALPLICNNIIQQSSGFIGTVMLAHLGPTDLAANALGSTTFITIIVFFFGALNAVGILVAQAYGAKNSTGVHDAMQQGLLLATLVSIPTMLLMWTLPKFLYQHEPNQAIALLATEYLRALSLGVLPLAYLSIMEQFLIGIGRAKIVLWISILTVPLEILFAYAFIFGKFGLPVCGVAGLGFGFTVAFLITIVIFTLFLQKTPGLKQYHVFRNFCHFINKKYLFELIRVGWPISINIFIEIAALAMMAILMGQISDDQLGAYQIARQYWQLAMVVVFALMQTASVRIGQSVGANNKIAAENAVYANIILGLTIMFGINIFYLIYRVHLIALDIDITSATYATIFAQTKIFFLFICVYQMLECFRLIAVGALRGLKDTRFPMFSSAFIFWIVALPLGYFFAFHVGLKGEGLWYGFLIGIACGVIILIKRLRRLMKTSDFEKIII